MASSLFDLLTQARADAGVLDPQMLAFCQREAQAIQQEVKRQVAMATAERQAYLDRVAGQATA